MMSHTDAVIVFVEKKMRRVFNLKKTPAQYCSLWMVADKIAGTEHNDQGHLDDGSG